MSIFRGTVHNLDASYAWTVEEVDVPNGYTASVSKDGTRFIITNTLDKDNPEDPTDPDNPLVPDKPDEPADTPDNKEEPGTVEPGTPVEPVEEPDLGDAPKTGDSSNAVPYVMLMLFAMAGLIVTRRKLN